MVGRGLETINLQKGNTNKNDMNIMHYNFMNFRFKESFPEGTVSEFYEYKANHILAKKY